MGNKKRKKMTIFEKKEKSNVWGLFGVQMLIGILILILIIGGIDSSIESLELHVNFNYGVFYTWYWTVWTIYSFLQSLYFGEIETVEVKREIEIENKNE